MKPKDTCFVTFLILKCTGSKNTDYIPFLDSFGSEIRLTYIHTYLRIVCT